MGLNDNDDGPRQSPVMRWLNFLVIMIVVGLVVAGPTAWFTFSSETGNGNRVRNATPITDQRWDEVKGEIYRNAVIGFFIGAAIGGIYVGKCLVRGVDP